jgi:protocatechuate 3,4-dioxygenase beta subunit
MRYGKEERMTGNGVWIGARRMAAGALLGLLATAVPAAAQAGRVVGRVTDAAGKPVHGASVVLARADSTAAERREATGETGGFDFSGVQPGVYLLRASGAGFRERVVRVELAPAELESVIARLPLARPAAALAGEPRPPRPRQR